MKTKLLHKSGSLFLSFQRTNKITRDLWAGNVSLHEWHYPEAERPVAIVNEWGAFTYDKQEPVEGPITWIFDADNFVPTAKIVDSKKYSIISNYLGTPQMMFDEDGKKVWEGVLDIY